MNLGQPVHLQIMPGSLFSGGYLAQWCRHQHKDVPVSGKAADHAV